MCGAGSYTYYHIWQVEYASGLVEQCRTQLLADFEGWMQGAHPGLMEADGSLSAAFGTALGRDGSASAYGTGKGGFGASEASLHNAGESLDQDEAFEAMETQMILSRDPDSLPFFKASKLAGRGGATNRAAGPRAKSRPFQ